MKKKMSPGEAEGYRLVIAAGRALERDGKLMATERTLLDTFERAVDVDDGDAAQVAQDKWMEARRLTQPTH